MLKCLSTFLQPFWLLVELLNRAFFLSFAKSLLLIICPQQGRDNLNTNVATKLYYVCKHISKKGTCTSNAMSLNKSEL